MGYRVEGENVNEFPGFGKVVVGEGGIEPTSFRLPKLT